MSPKINQITFIHSFWYSLTTTLLPHPILFYDTATLMCLHTFTTAYDCTAPFLLQPMTVQLTNWPEPMRGHDS